jgi:hypothetical protein
MPHYKPWTPHDDAELVRLYEQHNDDALAKMFKRTANAIATRRLRLNLRRFIRWTADEELTILDNWQTHNDAGLTEMLPGRTMTQVRKHRWLMGLVRK